MRLPLTWAAAAVMPVVVCAFAHSADETGGPKPGRSEPGESPDGESDAPRFDGLPPGGFPFGPGGFGPPGFGPGGFGRGGRGGRGPGGFGGPMGGPERKLVKQFDRDGDGRLNADERAAARASLKAENAVERPKPGRKLTPADVPSYPDVPLYEPAVLRTLLFEFEDSDWEAELADFKPTDVEVPAKLVVDGKTYPEVGMSFRGMSSFGMVPEGYKRSLNVSLDYADPKQRLYGYKTLNLLNCNNDPSFLRTVLALHIAAEQGIPAPKANLVRVVVNGESWGIYANAQQFNKEFVAEHFPDKKASRWKVPGSPGGRGGLEYLGDDVAAYERIYELKSGDGEKAWPKLIDLCRVLNETPADELEAALAPMLDLDEVLKFLAWDVALVNEDGYWVRASDYSIVVSDGRFSLVPHDANETFHEGGMGGPPGFGRPGFGPPGGGRGFGGPGRGGPPDFGPPGLGPPGGRDDGPPGGRRGGQDGPGGFGPGPGGFGGFGGFGPGGAMGPELDPLVGRDDAAKPLRSKLLAVPGLKRRYLAYVRDIAERSFDWNRLGPLVEQYASLIDEDVKLDTRKLSTYEAFLQQVGRATPSEDGDGDETRERGRRETSLRSFVERRRKFLLDHADVKSAGEAERR